MGNDRITMEEVLFTVDQFKDLPVEARSRFLVPWLKAAMIVLIVGERGLGKTFFALGVAGAITAGKSFGPWKCEHPANVVYVDAEMTVADIRDRLINMNLGQDRKGKFYIYSDAQANMMGMPRARLRNEQWRDEIKRVCVKNKIDVLILDNVASLAPGLDENSKKDWDPINQWLLELRFSNVSTILLHHTNKDGGQRGTSAREDNLDISISLKAPYDFVSNEGARFVAHFTKHRIEMKDLPLIEDVEFKLIEDKDGQLTWVWGNVRKETKKAVLECLDQGMGVVEAAGACGISKGHVSKIKMQAIKDGLITAKGKLSQSGFSYVNE